MQKISDEIIEQVSILAELSLGKEEKEKAKQDMEKMLGYVDKLKELDTEGVEPVSHIFSGETLFREDVVKPYAGGRADVLQNAPLKREDSFVVPKTVG